MGTFQGNGIASVGGGNTTGCSGGACAFSYTGDRTVTLRIPRPKLKLMARDTVLDVITVPDTIRFVASWSPTHLSNSTGSLTIPAQLLAWRWQPDTASQPTNVTTQCMYPRSTYTCMLNIRESGTMFVDMRLNGQVQTAELHVEVKQGKLTLSADKQNLLTPGEPVAFTAGTDPAGFALTVTHWEWHPDGASGATQACVAPATSCVTNVYEEGTMYVIGHVSGVTQIDSVKVYVIPCPTGDPALDDGDVRDSLTTHYNGAFKGHPSGGDYEPLLALYKNPTTGDHIAVPVPTDSTQACETEITAPPHMEGYEVVGFVHGHVTLTGRIPRGCTIPAATTASGGGGSPADWDAQIKKLPAQGFGHLRIYTMDLDGNIWRLNPNLKTKQQQAANPDRWSWDHAPSLNQPSGSCRWHIYP